MLSRSALESGQRASSCARLRSTGSHSIDDRRVVLGVGEPRCVRARPVRRAARCRTRGSSPASDSGPRPRPARLRLTTCGSAATTCRPGSRAPARCRSAGSRGSAHTAWALAAVRARREHRQPLREQPLGAGEQVPAPLDDGAQRAVPGQAGAVAAGQQPEAVGEPPSDLARPAARAAGRRPARSPAVGRRGGGRSRSPSGRVDSSSTKSGRPAAARSSHRRTAG